VNPLAEKLCGTKAPTDGLQAKLSLYHSAAVALLRGKAGVAEYEDACVSDPAIVDLRRRIGVITDPAVGKEQARVRVVLSDGGARDLFVEKARGSLERPMTDAELAAKFRDLAATELASPAIERLIAQCGSLATLPDAGVIARGSVA